MSRYVRNPTKTFEFDGDTVRAVLKPLSSLDLARLSGNETRADEVRVMSDILKSNVIELSGLCDAAGVTVGVETVADDAYFVALAADIFRTLVEISQPVNP